jgi:hypothetical protein
LTIAGELPSQWLHRWPWMLFDGAIWLVAIYGATGRFDVNNTSVIVGATLAVASVAAVTHLLVGNLMSPCQVGHRRGSFEEHRPQPHRPGHRRWVAGLGLWADPLVAARSVPVVAGALAHQAAPGAVR